MPSQTSTISLLCLHCKNGSFQDERACDQKASLYPFDSEDTELHMWLVLSMLHGGTDVKLSKLSMAPYVEKYANVKLDHLPNFRDENTKIFELRPPS